MAETLIYGERSLNEIRWTRDDCRKFEVSGDLNYCYELVEGVINRVGQNLPYAIVVRLITKWLFATFEDEFFVTQTSIDVRPEDNPTSEPMPDAIVLSKPDREFAGNPKPEEIQLLIEVSSTTLNYDLTTKAALYARAGIVEYWVVDVNARELIVLQSPENGKFLNIFTYVEGHQVAPLCARDKPILISRLFS